MEKFYDEQYDRYVFPTDDDLFNCMNDILMFLEENIGYGLHHRFDGSWVVCQMSVVTITQSPLLH